MTDHTDTYLSLADLAEAGAAYARNLDGEWGDFNGVESWGEAKDLAAHGWRDIETDALVIAESAVATVEREHDSMGFTPVWDTSGCEVDVSRYLSGEPENMIDYHMVEVPRNGRVITLCASVSVSGGIGGESLKRRGYGVAALALAMNSLGFATELWADLSASGGKCTGRIRVLVKGTNDELDPAKVMFAYAHPAMLRTLCFAGMHRFPSGVRKALDVGSGYGSPTNPKEDLPEGTIYLPCVRLADGIPEPADMLRRHLADLGIVE